MGLELWSIEMWPPDQSPRPHWAETVPEAEAERHPVHIQPVAKRD